MNKDNRLIAESLKGRYKKIVIENSNNNAWNSLITLVKGLRGKDYILVNNMTRPNQYLRFNMDEDNKDIIALDSLTDKNTVFTIHSHEVTNVESFNGSILITTNKDGYNSVIRLGYYQKVKIESE